MASLTHPKQIVPRAAAVESCSHCQLRCPLCPTTTGENMAAVGRGVLTPSAFIAFLERNPTVKTVELSMNGEVFMNRHFSELLKIAHERGVAPIVDIGANLNNVSDVALDALVRYKLRVLRVAIDGASNESYKRYRVGGDLKAVLKNIRAIQALKAKMNSPFPKLTLQFVVFGHNQHEMEHAKVLAKLLKIDLEFKLNHTPEQFSVTDEQGVRDQIGHSSRREYDEVEGKNYRRGACYALWMNPHVNWDGRLLGCRRNVWGAFGPNVFENGLVEAVNSPRMNYARDVLMGRSPEKETLPCFGCDVYKSLKKREDWITPAEIEAAPPIAYPQF